VSRINHDRPQLRWLDNARKELAKAPAAQQEGFAVSEWPGFLRPVAANPVALKALFDLFSGIDKWLESEPQISLSEPPIYVSTAYRSFAKARVQNPYDPKFCGRDWLSAAGNLPSEDGDFRKALNTFLKGVAAS
jgi:hypothetical protein